MLDPRNPELRAEQSLHGFRVLSQVELPNLGAVLTELEHESTGARHGHLSHPIGENAFTIAFRTLPEDSTGVAHILEHSVLEGSRDFPVKMFTQLTGRSMNSFLNAFTGADFTAYPFATSDPEDWDNLLRAYLDACLHPLLQEETFLQEGWRLELEKSASAETVLGIKGVVYNEMKAALSSPESQYGRRFRQELFPGSVYGHESGGDPERIPDLDVAGWRAFHKKYYQPGNAWSMSLGAFPLAPTLKRLNEAYAGFGRTEAQQIILPDMPGQHRRVDAKYLAACGDGDSAPQIAAVGWRLSEQSDLMESVRLRFLFEVLSGGLAAPLSRALLSSGLGPSLAPVGFNGGNTRLSFGAGLKQIQPGSEEEMHQLILSTLRNLRDTGLEKLALDTALDVFEMETREQNRVWGMPWSVATAWFALAFWMNGGNLEQSLRTDQQLDRLREEAGDKDFLPELIDRHLLENKESVLLSMGPDDGAFEAREEALALQLASKAKELSKTDLQELVDQAERVAVWRDDPGDLGSLPVLEPKDRPHETRPCELEQSGQTGNSLQLPAATNGLEHVEWVLPLDLDAAGMEWVDLLGWISQLSHAGNSLENSELRIRRLFGSFLMGSRHQLLADGSASRHELQIRLHALSRRRGEWLGLLEDMLHKTDFTDKARLVELLKMRQSNLRSRVINGATQVVSQIAQDAVCPFGRVTDKLEGLSFIRRLADLSREEDLGGHLSGLLEKVLEQAPAGRILCAERESLVGLDETLGKQHFFGAGSTDGLRPAAEHALEADDRLLAWTTSVDGAFHAQALKAPAFAHPDAGILYLLGAWMQLPLYERIRAAGGAYGARAGYDWTMGVFIFQSWRDPRLAGTVEDFAAVRQLAFDGQIKEDELDRAKIEALRRMDTPLLPHEESARCFQNRLLGRTDELRNQFRARLLDARPRELQDAATRWLLDAPKRSCVICPESMLRSSQLKGLDLKQEAIFPVVGV